MDQEGLLSRAPEVPDAEGLQVLRLGHHAAVRAGITAVVGPNGSGKSNVVDAIAWVLGEQGAKALRGGKMEDVIFAGTADRPPLGRAEVTLTIDNSDGALPIDYAEVSITRRMFRDGAGEYEINGSSCRLLDIQELLSDSGIGREMHVIVGQGQLDAVLPARPEDRRAFIEEAAGVLKHRKRKEKALRKLDAMQANLTRLDRPDRRAAPPAQAAGPAGRGRPPGRRRPGRPARRPAAAAGRRPGHADRTDRAGDPPTSSRRSTHRAGVQAGAGRRQRPPREAADARLCATATPALQQAQDTWFALSALAERLRGTMALAARARPEPGRAAGSAAVRPGPRRARGRGRRRRGRAGRQRRRRSRHARPRLATAVAQPGRTPRAPCAPPRPSCCVATRAIADRREGLARLAGQVNAARSRLAAGDDEVDPARRPPSTDARDRAAAAEAEFADAAGFGRRPGLVRGRSGRGPREPPIGGQGARTPGSPN